MWRLQTLVEKVHWFHGDRHTGLARLNDLYTQAVTELDPHMTREERSVCPAISRMEKTGVRSPSGALAAHIATLVETTRWSATCPWTSMP
jgi:regulator of cell morphogenesis and NO signaling